MQFTYQDHYLHHQEESLPAVCIGQELQTPLPPSVAGVPASYLQGVQCTTHLFYILVSVFALLPSLCLEVALLPTLGPGVAPLLTLCLEVALQPARCPAVALIPTLCPEVAPPLTLCLEVALQPALFPAVALLPTLCPKVAMLLTLCLEVSRLQKCVQRMLYCQLCVQ